MTEPQASLIKACIFASKNAKCRLDELVEIKDAKAAEQMVAEGLLAYDAPGLLPNCPPTHVRLRHMGDED
jgi:hypothetical protein